MSESQNVTGCPGNPRGWGKLIRITWGVISNLASVPTQILMFCPPSCQHSEVEVSSQGSPRSWRVMGGTAVGCCAAWVLWFDKAPKVFQSCVPWSAWWSSLHSTLWGQLFQKLLGWTLLTVFWLGCFYKQSPQGDPGEPWSLGGASLQKRASWLVRKLSRLPEVFGLEDTPLDLWMSNRPWDWGRGQAAFPGIAGKATH